MHLFAQVASYGIEAIWPYLNVNDLTKLESVKSRFLKKIMRLHFKACSRFVYQLAETDYFVNELMAKYSLPETDVSKKCNVQMIAKNQEIEPMFYDTPAYEKSRQKNSR
jgi:hypothetical protein